jgi:hypothetical protein
MTAALYGNASTVSLLLSRGADAGLANREGKTAAEAAALEHPDIEGDPRRGIGTSGQAAPFAKESSLGYTSVRSI